MTETSQVARVGDVERDRCISRLTTAMVDGQLDQAEFGDRLNAALGAKTRPELEILTQDLEGAESPLPATSRRTRPVVRVDPILAGGYVAVSGVLCALILGLLVLDDVYYGVLLWLFSLVCGGAGALLASRSSGKQ